MYPEPKECDSWRELTQPNAVLSRGVHTPENNNPFSTNPLSIITHGSQPIT
jgi:hypothetical protein